MSEHIYCLYCRPHAQRYVSLQVPHFFPCKAINPIVSKRKFTRGGIKQMTYDLLPGYVFLISEEEMNPSFLWRMDGILRILSDTDGTYALNGTDQKIAHWLEKYDGNIGTSKAVREGEMIRVIDGPLSDNIGLIKAVDKRKRCALVEFTFDQTHWSSWLDFDWVTADGDTQEGLILGNG